MSVINVSWEWRLILDVQVMSVQDVCAGMGEHVRPLVMALLLGLALADTVVDVEPWYRGLLLSLGLAAFHVNVVKYGAGTSTCCTTSS